MKIKFTRKTNDNGYGDFAGDDEYYSFNDNDENAAPEDDFAMGSMHTQPSAAPSAADSAPSPFASSTAVALKIVNPKGYEDAQSVADFLLKGNTVLLNIENLSRDQAIRLLDYLAGATHMVGGIMTKVGKTTIVVAPKNVDVSSIEAMVGGN